MKKRSQKANEEKEEEANKLNKQTEIFAACSFSALGLHPTLCDQLRERMGFEAPTHIQAQAIPVVLSGRHVLVNAATGTGKTVAYLAPSIHHLQGYSPRIERSHGAFALVLVPTRELCMQVYGTLQKLLLCFHWIVPGYIMGGISVLIATPGRLLDHLRNTTSFLHTDLHWIIFDEADSRPEAELEQLFLKCKTFRLHGNMKQEDRRTIFGAFKTEKLALLLSTDIAARGLDFPKVRCIIQYDSPGEATEYVHRVGSTARLGERGQTFLFLQPIELDYLHDLEKHGVSLMEYPLTKVLDQFPLYGMPCVKKVISLESHPWVMFPQKVLESFILAEPKMMKLAKSAFCSWIRAYTTHCGELKRIFLVKELHLGHVARSFALKDQPSLVGKSFQKQFKRGREMKSSGDKPKGGRLPVKHECRT